MPQPHPYPGTIQLETRWRLAREEMHRRANRHVVEPCRRRVGRLRALLRR